MQEKALAGIYCIDTFGTITVRISFGEDKERQIIQRLGRGDASAMDDLYALAADKLAGVCARYISAEADRKDILQESFIKIFTRIGSFDYRGHGSLMAWMTRIVVNESLLWLMIRPTRQHCQRMSCSVPYRLFHPVIGQYSTFMS